VEGITSLKLFEFFRLCFLENLIGVILEIFFSVLIISLAIIFNLSGNSLVSGLTFSLISLSMSFLFFQMGFEFIGILQTFFLIIPIFICLFFTKHLGGGETKKSDRAYRTNSLFFIILLSILFGFLTIILSSNHQILQLDELKNSLPLNFDLFFKESKITMSLLLMLFLILITGFLGINKNGVKD
jgi:NADH:ubiquinone oxidoreductase subunit 6 (subunit J)